MLHMCMPMICVCGQGLLNTMKACLAWMNYTHEYNGRNTYKLVLSLLRVRRNANELYAMSRTISFISALNFSCINFRC